jgi:hypothetical protein
MENTPPCRQAGLEEENDYFLWAGLWRFSV